MSPSATGGESSSEDGDPRFRIPRGASDEEIDSDEASGCGGSGDELDCSGASNPAERVPRDAISAAVSRLRAPGPESREGAQPGLDAPSSDDEEEEEEGLDGGERVGVADEVLEAATGVRDFAERARRRKAAVDARKRAKQVVGADAGEEGVVRSAVRRGDGHAGGHAEMMGKMMGVLEGSGGGGIGELKKRVGKIISANEGGGGALAVPLPAAVSGRIARGVAYGKTVEEIGKWDGVVKANRNKKELKFPLNEPGGGVSRRAADIGSGVVGKEGGVEKEIDDILKEAGVMEDANIAREEEKALDAMSGKVSKEDLLKKRRELARLRSVVFENDRKLKRIKKIKSRKFRKAMKAEKARAKEEARAAGVFGSDDDDDEGILAERERAEERMTLRHRNTSKWVKRQLQRGEARRNPETRAAVEEQLRLHEELRKKMESSEALGGARRGASDDESSESEDSQVDRAERDEMELAHVKDELVGEGDAQRRKPKQKGLMGLKFMQDAQERRRREALNLLGEMETRDEEAHSDFSEDEDEEVEQTRKDGSKEGKARLGYIGKGSNGASVGRRTFTGDLSVDGDATGRKKPASMNAGSREGAVGDVSGQDEDDEAEAAALRGRICEEYASTPAGMAEAERVDVSFKRRAANAIASAAAGDVESDGGGASDGRRRPFKTSLNEAIEVEVDDFSAAEGKPNESKLSATHEHVSLGSQSVNADLTSGIENPWLKPVSPAEKKRPRARASEAVEELVVPVVSETPQRPRRVRSGDAGGEQPSPKRVRFEKDLGLGPGSDASTGKHYASLQADDCGDPRDEGSDEEDGQGTMDTQSRDEKDISRMMVTARAFAGAGGADLADFQATKAAEIEKSLPTAKDIGAEVLPGWGAWSGAGSEGNSRKMRGQGRDGVVEETPFARAAREKLEAARAAAIAGRADGRAAHVVVSARRAKKAADLTMSSVPFPFTSAEQWEQEVSAPLVRERLTSASHDAAVKRKVIVRPGDALQPLRMSIATSAALEKKKSGGKSGALQRRGKRAQERDEKRKGLLI